MEWFLLHYGIRIVEVPTIAYVYINGFTLKPCET